jgi:hypothetical protein
MCASSGSVATACETSCRYRSLSIRTV